MQIEHPELHGLDAPAVWDVERAYARLASAGEAHTKRTGERRLHQLGILPPSVMESDLADEFGRTPIPSVLNWSLDAARRRRSLVLFAQLFPLPTGQACLHCNDARGARYWIPLVTELVTTDTVNAAFEKLQHHVGKPVAIFPHGRLVALVRMLPKVGDVSFELLSYPPVLEFPEVSPAPAVARSAYLQQLEAESIYILREAVAEAERPVMLYSIGKDSSVMLHLAKKAFYPAPPPFPLLHVDTRWKFQEMYLFRDYMAEQSDMDLLVHINPEAIEKDINPFEHGSALHTDVTKTEGLKQAIDKYGFDIAFGGARRDEEKSRAKERVFSFRSKSHRWDPKNQRPELWNLFNTRKSKGESIRVFPLSNWTELDIWQYIHQESIPIVPLYFAKERPIVVRGGMMIMVDDPRISLLPGEEIEVHKVRFRTLGCYPLTGAIPSNAGSVPEIILELLSAKSSERQGRAIDSDASASMERKKQEGYF